MSKAKSGGPSDGKWKDGFSDAVAIKLGKPAPPVPGFPMKFIWHDGPWYDIFQMQIGKLQRDIRRAKAEGRLVVYLSCPISSRGGGYSGTNVDVAKHVERQLMERWGEGFWVLNPAQYQLESKSGTGMMNEHADFLKLDLDKLKSLSPPVGGDYMRMWTTVLVQNETKVGDREIDKSLINTGQYFDAFYFLGPRDVQSFFLTEGITLTAGIQAYFARKFATDADFYSQYNDPVVAQWSLKRFDFLRYYGLKASANFSLGSHDEWLIFKLLNAQRRKVTENPGKFMIDGDVGEQLAGFFDSVQIDPASTEANLSRGYAAKS